MNKDSYGRSDVARRREFERLHNGAPMQRRRNWFNTAHAWGIYAALIALAIVGLMDYLS